MRQLDDILVVIIFSKRERWNPEVWILISQYFGVVKLFELLVKLTVRCFFFHKWKLLSR